MTTPTRSMARMVLNPPSPPPSAARLGQDSKLLTLPVRAVVVTVPVESSLVMRCMLGSVLGSVAVRVFVAVVSPVDADGEQVVDSSVGP
jgi:hypothetical protein